MGLSAWVTLLVVVATVVLLAATRLPPPLTVLGAVTLLLVAGVVDAEEAFAGFANPAPLTVAALYVVAAAAQKTGVFQRVVWRLLGSAPVRSTRASLLRVAAPTAAASAFLNNTPIVVMAAPAVEGWARRTGRSSSPYLIPISFAAILGGTVTVIGTSTNLVVSGLLQQAGERPLGFFELAAVGLPLALVGVAFLVLLSPRLLPARRSPSQQLEDDGREFTVALTVSPGSPLDGRSVAEAGLRSLEGVFLVAIARGARQLAPVGPDEVLREGDELVFAGNVERILDVQQLPGLTASAHRDVVLLGRTSGRRLYEVVVGESSVLVGATLKEVGFRARYGAAILAVHRAGARLSGKLGELELRPGDVLLAVADADFRRRAGASHDFLAVVPLDADPPPDPEHAATVAAVLAGVVVLAGLGLLDILPAALLGAFALVAARVLSPTEAREAIDLNVVVLIAASFGLGAALSGSGLAASLARLVVGPLGGLGDVGLLMGVLVATSVLTELITNNAAAVLMFPIAITTATEAGLDPRPFAIMVAIGASASFLTPIGYQTNTIVYGMGGYRFGDFARLGLPLTVLMLAVAAAIVPLAWPLR